MQIDCSKEITISLRNNFNASLGYATFLNRYLKVKTLHVIDINE